MERVQEKLRHCIQLKDNYRFPLFLIWNEHLEDFSLIFLWETCHLGVLTSRRETGRWRARCASSTSASSTSLASLRASASGWRTCWRCSTTSAPSPSSSPQSWSLFWLRRSLSMTGLLLSRWKMDKLPSEVVTLYPPPRLWRYARRESTTSWISEMRSSTRILLTSTERLYNMKTLEENRKYLKLYFKKNVGESYNSLDWNGMMFVDTLPRECINIIPRDSIQLLESLIPTPALRRMEISQKSREEHSFINFRKCSRKWSRN